MGEGRGEYAAAYFQAGDGCVLPYEADNNGSGDFDKVGRCVMLLWINVGSLLDS